ncbi:MAG: type II secretion system major pseudopilin GspG [Pseudomonadota bacterium]
MQRFNHNRRQAGFTLIEVMVVVVILGILAAFVVPNIMGEPDEARILKAKSDIRSIENALDMYRLDNHRYPTTDQGLEALVEKPDSGPEPRDYKQGGYMDRLPEDPWGNEYRYLQPGEHGEVDIWTLGADGESGGEDVNADIGNWNLED